MYFADHRPFGIEDGEHVRPVPLVSDASFELSSAALLTHLEQLDEQNRVIIIEMEEKVALF